MESATARGVGAEVLQKAQGAVQEKLEHRLDNTNPQDKRGDTGMDKLLRYCGHENSNDAGGRTSANNAADSYLEAVEGTQEERMGTQEARSERMAGASDLVSKRIYEGSADAASKQGNLKGKTDEARPRQSP